MLAVSVIICFCPDRNNLEPTEFPLLASS